MRFCVYDNFIPQELIDKLLPIVEYRDLLPYDNDSEEVSDMSLYIPSGISCNPYPPEMVEVVKEFFDYLIPVVEHFTGEWQSIEWWTNPNTCVPWHIDSELYSWNYPENHSVEFLLSRLPLISTVYYPWVDIESGGELILLDDPKFMDLYMSETESYSIKDRSLQTQIYPRTNRLVLFEKGIFHRVSEFEGKG